MLPILTSHDSLTANNLCVKLLQLALNIRGQSHSPGRPLRRVKVHMLADASINAGSGMGSFLFASDAGEGRLSSSFGVNRR